jgi:hypothetical protein
METKWHCAVIVLHYNVYDIIVLLQMAAGGGGALPVDFSSNCTGNFCS